MKTPPLFKNLYNTEKQINYTRKFDIKNFKVFLKNFDNPQNKIGKIIHIAGTNGKGSIAHILNYILLEAGYNVGLYTSPHLYDINERIKFNNKIISDYSFKKLEKIVFDKIKYNKKNYRTFFEAMTTLAFLYFQKKKTDWVILETGLGGRLDSTNIVSPHLTIITKIDFEHTQLLGNTLKQIAYEKSGIIKKNIPVFTFHQSKDINDTIKKTAIKKHSPLFITKEKNIDILNNNSFIYRNKKFTINQMGDYQKYNSALAIDIMNFLNIDNKHIKNGIEKFHIPGRLNIINKNPLSILDVSHTPNAIDITLNSIKKIYKNKDIYIIAIFMKDKDIYTLIETMKHFSKNIYITSIPFFRCADKNDYRDIKNISYFENVKKAYKYYLKKRNNKSILVFIGSFYFSKYVKQLF